MIRVGRGAQWSPEACAGARGPPRISRRRPLPRTPGRLPRPPEDAAASTTPCDTGELPDCLGFNLGSAAWPAVRPWAGDLTSLCGRCDESLVPSQGVAVRGSGVFTCQCVDQCPRPKLRPMNVAVVISVSTDPRHSPTSFYGRMCCCPAERPGSRR